MKKNLRNEMGTALRESTYAYIANPNGGPVHIALTQELDLAGDIWRIEDLAVRLIQTNDMPFSTQTDKHRNRKYLQATKLGKAVLNTLKMDVETLRSHSTPTLDGKPGYGYSAPWGPRHWQSATSPN